MKTESERRAGLQVHLNRTYAFLVHPAEEGGYVAEIPELPGCITQAETLEELERNIEDARKAWIEVAFEQGLDIPMPRQEEVYSGRFVVRVPKSLHRSLAEEAAGEGTSLNQYVLTLLASRSTVKQTVRVFESAMDRMAEKTSRQRAISYTPPDMVSAGWSFGKYGGVQKLGESEALTAA